MSLKIEQIAITLSGIFVGILIAGLVFFPFVNKYKVSVTGSIDVPKERYAISNRKLVESLNAYLGTTDHVANNISSKYMTTSLQELNKDSQILIGNTTSDKYYEQKDANYNQMINYIIRKMYININYDKLNIFKSSSTCKPNSIDYIFGYDKISKNGINNYTTCIELKHAIEIFVNIYLQLEDVTVVDITNFNYNASSNIPYSFILNLPTGEKYLFSYDLQLDETGDKEIKYIIIDEVK